jgi:hypothetical protein
MGAVRKKSCLFFLLIFFFYGNNHYFCVTLEYSPSSAVGATDPLERGQHQQFIVKLQIIICVKTTSSDMFLVGDSEMTTCLQERFLKFYEKATLGMTAVRHRIRRIQELEGGAALHQKDGVVSTAL